MPKRKPTNVGVAISSVMPSGFMRRAQRRTSRRNGREPSNSSSTTMIGTTMMKTRSSRLKEPCRNSESKGHTISRTASRLDGGASHLAMRADPASPDPALQGAVSREGLHEQVGRASGQQAAHGPQHAEAQAAHASLTQHGAFD